MAPVKINMVVKRGTNDDQIVPLARHVRDNYGPAWSCASSSTWTSVPQRLAHGRGAASAEVVRRLSAVFPLQPLQPNAAGETAQRWRYADGGGEIGVISSVTQAFCRDCNRARLSTEGKLFLCLFASRGHDLRALLRGGYSDEQIAGAIGLVWGDREDRYSNCAAPARPQRQRRAARRDALHRGVSLDAEQSLRTVPRLANAVTVSVTAGGA